MSDHGLKGVEESVNGLRTELTARGLAIAAAINQVSNAHLIKAINDLTQALAITNARLDQLNSKMDGIPPTRRE